MSTSDILALISKFSAVISDIKLFAELTISPTSPFISVMTPSRGAYKVESLICV